MLIQVFDPGGFVLHFLATCLVPFDSSRCALSDGVHYLVQFCFIRSRSLLKLVTAPGSVDPGMSCQDFGPGAFVFHFPTTWLVSFDSSRCACLEYLSRLLYDNVNSFSKVHENGTHLHALPRIHFRKLENILFLQSTEILNIYALKRKNIPSANRANDMIISKVTSDHFTSSLARATVDAM